MGFRILRARSFANRHAGARIPLSERPLCVMQTRRRHAKMQAVAAREDAKGSPRAAPLCEGNVCVHGAIGRSAASAGSA